VPKPASCHIDISYGDASHSAKRACAVRQPNETTAYPILLKVELHDVYSSPNSVKSIRSRNKILAESMEIAYKIVGRRPEEKKPLRRI
jgi:hypothetical protein